MLWRGQVLWGMMQEFDELRALKHLASRFLGWIRRGWSVLACPRGYEGLKCWPDPTCVFASPLTFAA